MEAQHSHILAKYLPQILPAQGIMVNQAVQAPEFKEFQLNNVKFAQLMGAEQLKNILPDLVAINIQEELNLLEQNDYLEVTFPIVGIADLLPNQLASQGVMGQVFAINGFAGGQSPLPEHIVAIDIVGNKYEILLDPNGAVTLPEEGSGLFSLLSAVTLMYSKKQLLDGHGLENVSQHGVEPGALYLLPPQELIGPYDAKICVSHLNENNQRIVSSLRDIHFTPEGVNDQSGELSVHVSPFEDSFQSSFLLEVNGNIDHKLLRAPMSLNVSIANIQNAGYALDQDGFDQSGWQQNTEYNNVFSKEIGLHVDTLSHLLGQSYTLIDMQKDFLGGDNFGLSQQNGYNDFVLQPEGLIFFHEKFVEGLVFGQVPASEFFDRVEPEHFNGIDFSSIATDEHDFSVLQSMVDPLDGFNIADLKPYLSSESNDEWSSLFTINANGLSGDQLPNAYAYLQSDQVIDSKPSLIDSSEIQLHLSEQAMNSINTISFYDPENFKSEPNEVTQGNVMNSANFEARHLDAGFSPLLAEDVFSASLPDMPHSQERIDLDALLPGVEVQLHASIHSSASSQLSDIEYNQGITNPFMFEEMPLMISQAPDIE